MRRKIYKTLLPCLILVSALTTIGSARAELKANSAVYAWDRTANRYQNSNVTIYLDGGWVPFVHQVDFDNGLYAPASCGGGTTKYAGRMEFGLNHTDNAPAGAPGFQETRNWRLVNCDRDGSGRFDNADLSFQPPQGFVAFQSLTPITQDLTSPCSTGNCQDEIITTLEVNLDQNCDGNIDAGIPTLVCFYAEARVPTTAMLPIWQQTLQARVTAGGGDKTVSFRLAGPTAITLVKIAATSGVAGFRNTITSAGIFTILILSMIGTGIWQRKHQLNK